MCAGSSTPMSGTDRPAMGIRFGSEAFVAEESVADCVRGGDRKIAHENV